jgi:AraC family transcriptional activator of pobA
VPGNDNYPIERDKFVSAKKYVIEEIIKIESVTQYNAIRGVETLHPLISVVDFSKTKPMPTGMFNFGLYTIYRKELNCQKQRPA